MADKKQQIRETLEAYESIIDVDEKDEFEALFNDLVSIMEAN